MKKGVSIFLLAFLGFIILQLLVPFVFGMGELMLGKIAFASYGLYLDKQDEEGWIVTLNWLMRGYGPILTNSLQFALAVLFFKAYKQNRKNHHSFSKIGQILLGVSIYLGTSSVLKFALDMSYDYATNYMRNPTNLSFIEKASTFYVFSNVFLLILLTIFVLQALNNKR